MQVVKVGRLVWPVCWEYRYSHETAYRQCRRCGLCHTRITVGFPIIVSPNDDFERWIFGTQSHRDRLKVSRVECHRYRVPGCLMDACAGCEALADNQSAVGLADAEIQPGAPAAVESFLVAAVRRIDALYVPQLAVRVTHWHDQKAVGLCSHAVGLDALACQVVMLRADCCRLESPRCVCCRCLLALH